MPMPPRTLPGVGGQPPAPPQGSSMAPVPPADRGAGPYPAGPPQQGPDAQLIQQGLSSLTQQEMRILDQQMTPELLQVFARLFGPGVAAALAPFAGPSDLQRAVGQLAQPMGQPAAPQSPLASIRAR